MAIKDYLLNMISVNQYAAKKLLDDVSEEDSMVRGQDQFNHIRWQVGHMLYADTYALSLVGGKLETDTDFAKLFGGGSVCSDNPADYPAYAELRDHLFAVYDMLGEAVEKASDADLEKPTDEKENAEPIWKTISFMLMHDFYHGGQVVHIRKVLGRERPFG